MLKRRLKEPFGKAGLTVAVLALVVAMAGGAYAAGGLTKAQEKQVTKIAKKYAGKPGAAGASGPAGPAGAKGDAGAAGGAGKEGAQGKEGAAGKNGTNGTNGSPWTAGGTLPQGATETGTWEGKFEGVTEGNSRDPISFSVPLEAAIGEAGVHYVTLTQQGQPPAIAEGCPGTGEQPEAEEGDLCVYEAFVAEESGTTALEVAAIVPPSSAGVDKGTGVAGAILFVHYEGPAEVAELQGSWAVTG